MVFPPFQPAVLFRSYFLFCFFFCPVKAFEFSRCGRRRRHHHRCRAIAIVTVCVVLAAAFVKYSRAFICPLNFMHYEPERNDEWFEQYTP